MVGLNDLQGNIRGENVDVLFLLNLFENFLAAAEFVAAMNEI